MIRAKTQHIKARKAKPPQVKVRQTLHDLRRYEDAIFFYQAQLFFNPQNKYSHLNLSLALARLKRFDEAEHEHLAQLALHPTDRNTGDYYLELLNDMHQVSWLCQRLPPFFISLSSVAGARRGVL